MADADKPVIVLVHGAWHQPIHFRRLIDALKAEGQTVLVPPLASAGYDDSIDNKVCADDVRRIHEVLLPYLDSGRKAVVVAHSYGGVPGTAAVEAHTVAEREARGLPGGIISVVYIAALPAVQKGISMYEAGGNVWTTAHFHHVGETKLPLKMEPAVNAFYNDLDDTLKAELSSYLSGQSRAPFEEVINFIPSQIKVPKTYVVCKQDQAVPVAAQEYAVQMMEAERVELDCGHTPFAKPAETAVLVKVILEAAKK